jgi:hypothetical protein
MAPTLPIPSKQDDFCALRVDEAYCREFVGEEVTVELGGPGQAVNPQPH